MRKITFLVLLILIICILLPEYTVCNDYSSFLSANASIAVVVDHEYMQRRGENILAHFQKILSDTIRENLKNGGINIKYFTWNAVRLKKDFLAAITVTDCKSTWNFYEQAQLRSILLIAITDANCPRLPLDHALMVPTVGHGEEFSQMMLDIKLQEMLNWKTAVALMDNAMLNENSLMVQSVSYESIREHISPISVLLYKLDDTLRGQKMRIAIRQALAPFAHRTRDHHQFVVLSKSYDDIIEIAESLEMFHIYNQWLFFILEETSRDFDVVTVTQNLKEGVNIAFVLNETLPDCMDTINCTITELSMALVTSISRMIDEEQAIYGEISDEEWEAIRYTKREKQDEILKYMKEYMKSNSKCSSCSKWRLETAISWGKNKGHQKVSDNEAHNRNFQFINIGYWSPLLGFITQELVFPHVSHYFRNITMDIITIHNPPWQILTKDNKGNIIEHRGIVMEILKELSRMLNFTYQLHDARVSEDDELTINYNETDELVGSLTYIIPYQVVRMIQGNQVLMAAVAATIDDPDKKPFNYSVPISIQEYSFIARRPDEVSRIYLFTAPFTIETWACLFGVILITAPALYIVNRLTPMQHMRNKGLGNVKNCFWYVYGALLQQGGVYLPQADSGRLIIGIWWIVVIVLVTTYCGNLVAFLTFPKFQPGLDYLFQLFKNNHVEQYGLRNGSLFEKFATISSRNELRQYVERAIIYNSREQENIAAVEEGKRVNIDWRINLQLIVQMHFEKNKECKFLLSKENLLDEQIGLIMPNNSPYLHLINEQILRMFRMGFIERWHQTNLPSMDKCNGKNILRQITNHKVNLDDMQGCFLVLLFGFIAALFIIMTEYWYYRFYVITKETGKNNFAM